MNIVRFLGFVKWKVVCDYRATLSWRSLGENNAGSHESMTMEGLALSKARCHTQNLRSPRFVLPGTFAEFYINLNNPLGSRQYCGSLERHVYIFRQ